jgi:hypothetical protein
MYLFMSGKNTQINSSAENSVLLREISLKLLEGPLDGASRQVLH